MSIYGQLVENFAIVVKAASDNPHAETRASLSALAAAQAEFAKAEQKRIANMVALLVAVPSLREELLSEIMNCLELESEEITDESN